MQHVQNYLRNLYNLKKDENETTMQSGINVTITPNAQTFDDSVVSDAMQSNSTTAMIVPSPNMPTSSMTQLQQQQQIRSHFQHVESFNQLNVEGQNQMFKGIGSEIEPQIGEQVHEMTNVFEESFISQQTDQSQEYYYLTLNIHYETKFGEYLCVTGDIEELGAWKSFKCRLQWTEGHIWVTPKPIRTAKPFIQYKYLVLHREDEPKQWESGHNRIADLSMLEQKELMLNSEKPKHMTLVDVWNSFTVKFSVFYPSTNDQDELSISGIKNEIDYKLTKSKQAVPWLPNKYGQNMQVFEGQVLISNDDLKFDLNKQILPIKYKYILNRKGHRHIMHERDNSLRVLDIMDPKDYTGLTYYNNDETFDGLGGDDKLYIINGRAEKSDGNFLRPFLVQQLDNTGVFCGSYPDTSEHISELVDNGVTAVLCLQTEDDFKNTHQQWKDTLNLFKSSGIMFAKNFQVSDSDEHEYHMSIFQACQYINDMVNNKKQQVFIFCNTGLSRAPTIIMAYLCMYKEVKNWQDIDQVAQLVKLHLRGCQPNVIAVKNVIMKNISFQDKQSFDSINYLRSADSVTDLEDLLLSEPSVESEIPMFEGSPKQKVEGSFGFDLFGKSGGKQMTPQQENSPIIEIIKSDEPSLNESKSKINVKSKASPKKRVVTESTLLMMQQQILGDEMEKLSNMIDSEQKRQQQIADQQKKEWEVKWAIETKKREMKNQEISEKRDKKDIDKQELRKKMDEAKARRRKLEDEEDLRFRQLEDLEIKKRRDLKEQVQNNMRQMFENECIRIRKEQNDQEIEKIKQNDEKIQKIRDELRVKILEKMRLRPDQIIPDVTVWNDNNQPGAKSDDMQQRKSITDKSENFSLIQGMSMIEPNSKYHDSKLHIDLNGTQYTPSAISQISEFKSPINQQVE